MSIDPTRTATFSQRVGLELLDTLILFPFTVWIYKWGPQKLAISHHSALPVFLWHVSLWIGLSFIISRFGGTPGCLMLRAKIQSQAGESLHFIWALIRTSPKLLLGLFLTLSMSLFVRNLPATPLLLDSSQISTLLALYGGVYYGIYQFLRFFGVFDVLIVFFNAHSRSIIDFLSRSSVYIDE